MAININASSYGAFIPSSQVWDVSEIYQTEGLSPELKELMVRLYQNLNNMANSVNTKETAFYSNQEFATGQTFPPSTVNSSSQASPPYRQSYRTMVDFGALPNSASKSVAQNIIMPPAPNSGFSATRIWGAATNQTGSLWIPIPYASSTLAKNIQLDVNATHVIITTAFDWSAYTVTKIFLEYLKN